MINDELKEHGIGVVTEAHVHWKTREVLLNLQLEGEAIPIELTASQLAFFQIAHEVFVSVGEVKCSRIWIEKVAMKMLPDLKAKLPVTAAMALKPAGVVKPEKTIAM